MRRIDRIRIEGFRRLVDVPLELRPLNVLIGANASGKTSLLDSLALLGHSAQGRLRASLSEMGGIGANLSLGGAPRLAWQISSTTADDLAIRYRLALRPQGAGYEIAEESLSVEGPKGAPDTYLETRHGALRVRLPAGNGAARDEMVSPLRQPEPGETALSIDPGVYAAPAEFRKRLASIDLYRPVRTGRLAPIRLPQPLQPSFVPGPDGESLISCLFNLRETDRERFALLEDTLRAGFHDFERLDFPPVAAGTLAMTWRDRRFSQPFYLHQLSEGAIRFLWLATLLQSPGLGPIALIDEPEVSLHPELLSLLAELLREASDRTQLVVATQSEGLVRFLQPSEVVVFNVADDGAAAPARADELDLEAWLREYTLDEVWRQGRLGGLP